MAPNGLRSPVSRTFPKEINSVGSKEDKLNNSQLCNSHLLREKEVPLLLRARGRPKKGPLPGKIAPHHYSSQSPESLLQFNRDMKEESLRTQRGDVFVCVRLYLRTEPTLD